MLREDFKYLKALKFLFSFKALKIKEVLKKDQDIFLRIFIETKLNMLFHYPISAIGSLFILIFTNKYRISGDQMTLLEKHILNSV
jgi:hypothetical protein